MQEEIAKNSTEDTARQVQGVHQSATTESSGKFFRAGDEVDTKEQTEQR